MNIVARVKSACQAGQVLVALKTPEDRGLKRRRTKDMIQAYGSKG